MEVHPHIDHYANVDEQEPQNAPRGIFSAGTKGLVMGAVRGFLLAGAAAIALGLGLSLIGMGGFLAIPSITEGLAAVLPKVFTLALHWGAVSAALDGIHNAWHSASIAHKNATKERFANAKPSVPARAPVYPQVAMVPQLTKQQEMGPAQSRSETHFRDMVDASRTNQTRRL